MASRQPQEEVKYVKICCVTKISFLSKTGPMRIKEDKQTLQGEGLRLLEAPRSHEHCISRSRIPHWQKLTEGPVEWGIIVD